MAQSKNFNILYKNPMLGNIFSILVFYTIFSIIIIWSLDNLSKLFALSMENQYILTIVVLIAFSLIYILYLYFHSYWHDITKFYIENIPNEIKYKENEEYAGVIIANYKLSFHKYFHINNGCVLLLIESLRNKGIPIKIVKKADKKRFLDLVYDEKCTELYIIGHGRRYRFTLHKKEHIDYSTLADAPKKKRIEQLHCNHKAHKGKALSELLRAEEKYKSLKSRSIEEVINIGLNELLFGKKYKINSPMRNKKENEK